MFNGPDAASRRRPSGARRMNRFTKAALVALALTTTAAPIAAQAQKRGER